MRACTVGPASGRSKRQAMAPGIAADDVSAGDPSADGLDIPVGVGGAEGDRDRNRRVSPTKDDRTLA